MRYTVYSLMFFIISFKSYAQFSVECVVELEEKNDLKAVIKIYNKDEGFIDEALEGEVFLIESEKSIATFIFIANDYSLIEKEIDWLFNGKAAQWSIILCFAWRSIPFLMVIMLAALQGVPMKLLMQLKWMELGIGRKPLK